MHADRNKTALSKYLSFVLRHDPTSAGLELDASGWVAVDALLAACNAAGRAITRAVLDDLVATSPKQRFAFSADGTQIRASQGHSVEVDLAYAPAEPPDVLFHGTVAESLEAIRASGLEKRSRHHVHLSADIATAQTVGGRRGKPIVLRIKAKDAHRAGHVFYLSANGVWLVDAVPPALIEFPSSVAQSNPAR